MKLLQRFTALAFLFFLRAHLHAANETEVAVYNAVLASVPPGQATVEMGDMTVPVTLMRARRGKAMGLRG